MTKEEIIKHLQVVQTMSTDSKARAIRIAINILLDSYDEKIDKQNQEVERCTY